MTGAGKWRAAVKWVLVAVVLAACAAGYAAVII